MDNDIFQLYHVRALVLAYKDYNLGCWKSLENENFRSDSLIQFMPKKAPSMPYEFFYVHNMYKTVN